MSEKLTNFYNKLYLEKGFAFSAEPTAAVKKISEFIAGGKVLDIGGGEGRNAVYLAEQGFSVSVIDLSHISADKLSLVAEEKGLKIETRVADVAAEGISGSYDAIVWSFVLHHIDEEGALRLIQESKDHTNIGGVHAISTFSNSGDLYEESKDTQRFYPDIDTIKNLYSDWEIMDLSEFESKTKAKNSEGENLRNMVISLVAVRNN